MSREKVAQFKARFKDPVVREKIKNAISYRQTRKVPYEEILEYLKATFGEPPTNTQRSDTQERQGLDDGPSDSTSQADGLNPPVESGVPCQEAGLNSTCKVAVVECDGLNSTSKDSTSQADMLNPVDFGHNAGLNPGLGDSTCQNGRLNSTSEDSTSQADGLNSTSQDYARKDDGRSYCLPEKEPTAAEVAAVIASMQNLQRTQLNHLGEGVVIEMPYMKERAGTPEEAPADLSHFENRPLEAKTDTPPKEAPAVEQGKTAQKDPMRLASGPSLTSAVFASLALTALIGSVSYYLILATKALYGTPVAALLVLIPLSIVFFVPQAGPRYLALLLFIGADVWSIKTLHLRDVAVVEETSLSTNGEYQRLKEQHELLRVEREALDPATRISARRKKSEEMKIASDRMAEIEASAKTDKRAEADMSTADVTLAVRALLLLGNALLAHALIYYSRRLDFDALFRWAFRE